MMLKRFFAYLDRILFLNINIWDFSYHSFFRECARVFFFKVILKHPVKTIRGLKKYRDFIKTQENIFPKYKEFLSVPDEMAFLERIKRQKIRPLVGLGFCLKPINPEEPLFSCPSGRANHNCLYIERGQTWSICASCAIFRIARKCLETGCKVYIMTSAKDIARDFLIPHIDSGKFPTAILLLCPFSVQAIIPSLFICDIDMFLLAYSRGYCRDYQEWLKADRGNKKERTVLNRASWEKLLGLLSKSGSAEPQPRSFRREGNIFYPEYI